MDDGFPKKCCVCGRTLPSKYAVAGSCESGDGCAAVFCAWHWHSGNRLCPEHGWKPDSAHPSQGGSAAVLPPMETPVPTPATVNLTVEQKKTAARAALDAISKLGAGVAELVKKLAGVQDPQEMIDSFGSALDANRARREPLRARYDALFREIAEKKKSWQSAPPARKKLLEFELKTLLSEYKGIERQLTAFYENERTLVAVRTRVEEIVALEMRKISEKQIDRLSDKLDDAVSGAEDVSDALRDLESAGKRRDRESDSESFADELAAFDMPEDAGADRQEIEPLPPPVRDPSGNADGASRPGESPVPSLADLLP